MVREASAKTLKRMSVKALENRANRLQGQLARIYELKWTEPHTTARYRELGKQERALMHERTRTLFYAAQKRRKQRQERMKK